jgi:hypothetical protein
VSPADRLLLAAILRPNHRAEDGDLVVLAEAPYALTVLRRLPCGTEVGFRGLSALGARGVVERLRGEPNPYQLLADPIVNVWAPPARENADAR